MNPDAYEEVESVAESTSFLPMTAEADVKTLTEHKMFLMLQIASRRKETARGRKKERGRFFIISFSSPDRWQRTLFLSPPGRSRFEQKVDVPESRASRLLCHPADLCVCLYTRSVSTLHHGEASCV